MFNFDYNFDHILDEKIFARFADAEIVGCVDDDLQNNYCPDCKIPMEISGTSYHCANCGLSTLLERENDNLGDTGPASVRVSTGSSRGRYYTITGDYSKVQHKAITKQLLLRRKQHDAPPIQISVLRAAANQYNNIQKNIIEDDFDENGAVCGKKKFVRRGAIKDEILAALIYFECVRQDLVRKKKDIAVFMDLPTDGFSRGENILRDLESEGLIEPLYDNKLIKGFVDRYLDALNIENEHYDEFIVNIVNTSEELKICMNSQISSKIVGAIWVVIVKCKLNISAQELEKATDNTKKNTFVKFYNAVFSNIRSFAPLFAKYNIPC